MKRLLLLVLSFLAASVAVHAETIDFKAMAEPAGSHGESAWNALTLTLPSFTVSITATKNGNSAYAYLDSGNAGLGACGALVSGATANQITHSSSNLCDPSNDDNTTSAELLRFVFDHDVIIDTIWFNNNHDGDTSLLNNTISIGGSNYTFSNGGALQDSYTTTPFSVAANTNFDITWVNEQFYVSKMTARTVPEPASIVALSLGLIALAAARRRSIR